MEQSLQGARTSILPIGTQKDVITKAIQLFTDKHSVSWRIVSATGR